MTINQNTAMRDAGKAWAQNDATKRQLKNLASFKAAYDSNGHHWGWDWVRDGSPGAVSGPSTFVEVGQLTLGEEADYRDITEFWESYGDQDPCTEDVCDFVEGALEVYGDRG